MNPSQEYHDRMARLQASIRQKDLDAFLVTAQDSIYYLTGITYIPLERPFFILVRPTGGASLLAPALDQEHLSEAPNVAETHRYWDYPSPSGEGWPERLADLLEGVRSLGIEPTLPQEIAACIAEYQPAVLPLVEDLRLVKSPYEVEKLRQAAKYADLGMQRILHAAYAGVSELEIYSQARSVQLRVIRETEFDALNTSLLTAAWPARLGTQPHGVPAIGERLESGPHIALSFMRVNGYGAECERTFFVIPPTRAMQDMFAAMLEARQRAYALVRPGAACAEIDCAATGFLRQEGLADYRLHRTGHGLGLGNHEGPWVADGSPQVLAENMLISIEPGIYIPGLGGFRHSDTVLVTASGYEILTHSPEDIGRLSVTGGKFFTRLQGALVRKAVGL